MWKTGPNWKLRCETNYLVQKISRNPSLQDETWILLAVLKKVHSDIKEQTLNT